MNILKQNLLALINIFVLFLITIFKILACIIKAAVYIIVLFLIMAAVYLLAMGIEAFEIQAFFESVEIIIALPIVLLCTGLFGVFLFLIYYLVAVVIGICNKIWMEAAKAICMGIEYVINLLIDKLYLPISKRLNTIDSRACFFIFDYVQYKKTGLPSNKIKIKFNKECDAILSFKAFLVNLLYCIEYLFYSLVNKRNFLIWSCPVVSLVVYLIYQNHQVLLCTGLSYFELVTLFHWQDLLATAILILYIFAAIVIMTIKMIENLENYAIFTCERVKSHIKLSYGKIEATPLEGYREII